MQSDCNLSYVIILSIIINPLTARIVGAPQMILQPVFSIFSCSPLPSGTCLTQGLSIHWCCLPTSSFVRLVFFPLSLCLARWFWPDLMKGRHDHTTAVCISLRLSGDLHVVQLPAGTWHELFKIYKKWEKKICTHRPSALRTHMTHPLYAPPETQNTTNTLYMKSHSNNLYPGEIETDWPNELATFNLWTQRLCRLRPGEKRTTWSSRASVQKNIKSWIGKTTDSHELFWVNFFLSFPPALPSSQNIQKHEFQV